MSCEPNSKKSKSESLKIGTHNGTFHCDDVFACFMLKQLPEYKNADIIRSRDPSKLSECDIVVDVGGVYDRNTHRYDHHQRTFSESLSTIVSGKIWQTKLSSAGLVYAHFGKRVISNIIKKGQLKREIYENCVDDEKCKDEKMEDMVDVLYDKIYEGFVEAVDAIDNGINVSADLPRYSINTDISSRVAHLNPSWNDPNGRKEEVLYEQFAKAMKMVGDEFVDRVKYFSEIWWPARLIVEKAMKDRFQVDESSEIMLLEMSCPWKDHLRMLEEEEETNKNGEKDSKTPLVKYILYPDANNTWMVQCIPAALNSFENRLSLPQAWRGLRDEELSRLCKMEGCVFVHASGFVGGHKTKEGALTMARESLKIARKESEHDNASDKLIG